MSWSSSHSVRWTDALFSTFVGWVLWLEFSKETVRWTDGPSIGSSGDLGFGSKVQSSASSASDDPMLWPAVYTTPTFKSDRDAPKDLLQHRMNRRFKFNSVVHPMPLFGLHSTAPSGCSSALDGPMGRVTPGFKGKPECIHTCASGSSFTHALTQWIPKTQCKKHKESIKHLLHDQ
jgi:hypothetical protein